jgi:hypothetical protein
MRHQLKAFLNDLIMYDYVLFGGAFFLFFLLIILAIVVRKKLGFSIFLILLSLNILLLTPTLGYKLMHEYLFKNEITIIKEKKLEYTKAIVIKGSLLNSSNRDFKSCKIIASVHKSSSNKYRHYFLGFKSIQKMSTIELTIAKGETRNFKLIVSPFTYTKNYNITLKGKCK